MSERDRNVAPPSFLEALRDALLGDDAVVVSVDGEPRFYLEGRTVFLPPGDPLAARLSALGERGAGPRQGELLRELAARLRPELPRLIAAPGDRPVDAAGPLAAEPLLMEIATQGSTDEMAELLGGEQVLLGARRGQPLQAVSGLDPRAVFVLSRLEAPQALDDIPALVRLETEEVLPLLVRLWVAGLIEPASVGAPPEQPLGPAVVARLGARIAESLDREPLALEAGAHRRALAQLLQSFGGKNYYELLGIEPAAEAAQVQAAFEQLGRLVHPRHSETLALGSSAVLAVIFERAVEAYLALSDPKRRAFYDQLHDIGVVAKKSQQERREERHRLAHERYVRALHSVEQEQYHYAIELLRDALRLFAKAEYYALLGSCLARNPNWIDQAVESYKSALQLQPKEPGLQVALGQLYERLELPELAKKHYAAALETMPDHPEASIALERLGVGGKRRLRSER